MHKTPIAEASDTQQHYLAFRPRQVALQQLRHSHPGRRMDQKRLTDEQRTLLLRSIARFLQSNGFSKTFKKFRSEAQLQDSEDSVFDLEDISFKFLVEKRDDTGESKKVKQSSDSIGHQKQLIEEVPNPAEDGVVAAADKKSKDKKKKKKSNPDSDQPVDGDGQLPPESQPVAAVEKSKDPVVSETDKVTENRHKEKKKKKSKHSSDPADKVEQPLKEEGNEGAKALDDKNGSSKAKKKKKDAAASENVEDAKSDKVDSEKDNLKKDSNEDVSEKQSKGSKKRKRVPLEEDGTQPTQEKVVDDSKRRKTDGSEETNGNEQSTQLKLSSATDGEAQNGDSSSTPKIDGHANGSLKANGEKSEKQKSTKKPDAGSVEPKTANRFQRVKVEEVVFTDERLQDNSYWAKDGADSGYGAKAQEVLGQVRGRYVFQLSLLYIFVQTDRFWDFRHEKTKKKRGTYRGGQIDLQSHSVKFNYSDDE
ncbi:hypothetical protein Tsubulata_048127 [Turnera subulata]|uniref:LisH domain-containing protein n=1 Tax=Turnera subulata TaxID=218843 RepID=A0A9Q0FZQ0_9ROSI|nr:hypothetical protein Tsubulata_048127 [Turnera subulata]